MKDLLKVIETVGGMCGRYERLQTAFNVMERATSSWMTNPPCG